jgi:hypothetical protein
MRLVEVVIAQLERAFDPHSPNLSLVSGITQNLMLLLRNMSTYDVMMKDLYSTRDSKRITTKSILEVFNVHSTIGSLLVQMDSEKDAGVVLDETVLADMKKSVSNLKAAMKRSDLNTENWPKISAGPMAASDIPKMRSIIALKRPIVHVLWHCLHLLVMDEVESNLTMAQLFEYNKSSLERVETLWKALMPSNDIFDPETTTMRYYRENVCLPAMIVESQV